MSNSQPPRMVQGPPASTARALLRAATGLGLKLGLLSTLVVSVVVGASAAYSYMRERDRLLESMHQAASTQGRLTLTGLQFAMLENNRTLLHDLVAQYARSVEVDRVFVTDATGNVAIASAPEWAGRRVALPDDVCPTCQLPAGAPQTRTGLETVGGRRVLRSLTVISNEARCLRCHPSVQRTLGTLAVDFSMAPIDQAREAMVTWMLLWGAGVAVLVLVAVGLVVQVGALAPLRRLRDVARSLLPDAGKDAPPRDEIVELADDLSKVSSALHDTQVEVDRQRRFLVDLLDHVEDGVAVLDRSLTVVAANQSYLRRVGCDRDRIGRGEVKCGETALCGQAELAGECPTRMAFRSARLEKRITRHPQADRQTFVEVFASPIVGADGRVEQVVEVWRDVSERVALQANLVRSEQLAAVGTLATGFSHEISTPLGTVSNSIQGMLRILGDREHIEGPEVAALRHRLELASSEVFRCRDITRSLLDLGRRRRTVRDRVRIEQVVERMIQAVAPTAEQRGVAVVNRSAPGMPAVLGREDELAQVMLNLFMNGIEAMPRGGTLEVVARACDSGVEVIVADSGPGIAAGDRDRLFEPFFTKKSGGTGLGLYLSRQLVETHGGRLELLAGDGGARFRIFLPGQAEPAPARAVNEAGGA
ncbi:MAG TPA: ATP-binding protein [Myxococcales bacterium]|nr:ATP-binding protein [Myxococcales bacterium]